MFEKENKYKHFGESFLRFERRKGVWDVQIDDVHIWKLIRKHVNLEIRQQKFDRDSENNSTTSKRFQSIRGGLWWLYTLGLNNPFFNKNKDLVVIGRERRKKLDDGYWWDIHCDPIYEHLNKEYVHLEHPYNHFNERHRTPAKTAKVYYLETIEYAGTIQRKLGINTSTLSREDRQSLKRIEDEIKDWFGVHVDVINKAERRLNVRKTEKWLYRRLLDRIDPEVVLIAKGPNEEEIVEVCSELDILTVGLQHGIIDKYHVGYHHPEDRPNQTFPDHFMVWGDYWKKSVNLPVEDENIYSVGYPFLEQQTQDLKQTIKKNQIVFVPSPQYGKHLSKIAVQYSEMDQTNIEIVFKLHPSEVDDWERNYPWLVESSVIVADGTNKTLYQLFAESRAQVGIKSTAIYEGLYFGLDTFLLNLPEVVRLEQLIKNGHATLIESATDLHQYLETDNQNNSQFDPDYFFEENATEIIVQKLNELVDQSGE